MRSRATNRLRLHVHPIACDTIHTTSRYQQRDGLWVVMMILKLLTRCPRHAPCTPLVTQAGCHRTYADVSRHELSKKNPWSPSRKSGVVRLQSSSLKVTYSDATQRPTRTVREDWNQSPKVQDGQLTVNVKTRDLGMTRIPLSVDTINITDLDVQQTDDSIAPVPGLGDYCPAKYVVTLQLTARRDNCACAECRNPDTAQRRVNVFKVGISEQSAQDSTAAYHTRRMRKLAKLSA